MWRGACRDFQNCLMECELDDLGFNGSPFTWFHGDLKERLDRVVMNLQWHILFDKASIYYLPFFKSDQSPLWLKFKEHGCRNRGLRPFRFVASWLFHEEFLGLVSSV